MRVEVLVELLLTFLEEMSASVNEVSARRTSQTPQLDKLTLRLNQLLGVGVLVLVSLDLRSVTVDKVLLSLVESVPGCRGNVGPLALGENVTLEMGNNVKVLLDRGLKTNDDVALLLDSVLDGENLALEVADDPLLLAVSRGFTNLLLVLVLSPLQVLEQELFDCADLVLELVDLVGVVGVEILGYLRRFAVAATFHRGGKGYRRPTGGTALGLGVAQMTNSKLVDLFVLGSHADAVVTLPAAPTRVLVAATGNALVCEVAGLLLDESFFLGVVLDGFR